MDDLEFRRRIYSNPNDLDNEVTDYIADNESQKRFVNDVQSLDLKLKKALEVDVPDSLADRLILRQTLESHKQQTRKSRIHLSLAASVAFAVGLTINMVSFSNAEQGIGEHALAHVYHELKYTDVADSSIQLTAVNAKLASFGGNFASDIGKVVYSNFCSFNGQKSLHMVVQSDQGPITVFIMPTSSQFDYESEFSDDRFKGETMEFGNRQVIIVGDKEKSLSDMKLAIEHNLNWEV